MRFLNALSCSPNVHHWIHISRQLRILHIFDHACNLLNERGEVLSVVSKEIGNGPFNLVIDNDVLFSENLKENSPVSIQMEQLNIGDWIIRTAGADIWFPRPNWESLHRKKMSILNQLFQLDTSISQFDNPLASKLSHSIANEDFGTAKAIASQLAGLGQGLTPAGDDIIFGTILAAWIIYPFNLAAEIAKEITDIAAPQTTSLSAAWLRSAGNGEVGVLWHELLSALLTENSIQTQIALDKILAVGETSGADALTGFISTLISYAERETKLCHS